MAWLFQNGYSKGVIKSHARQACRFHKQQVLCRDWVMDLVENFSGKLSECCCPLQLFAESLFRLRGGGGDAICQQMILWPLQFLLINMCKVRYWLGILHDAMRLLHNLMRLMHRGMMSPFEVRGVA